MWNVYLTGLLPRSLRDQCYADGGTEEDCGELSTTPLFATNPVGIWKAGPVRFPSLLTPSTAISENVLVDGNPILFFEEDPPTAQVYDFIGGEIIEITDDIANEIGFLGWESLSNVRSISTREFSYAEYYIADGVKVLHEPSGLPDHEFYKVPFYSIDSNDTNTGTEEFPKNAFDDVNLTPGLNFTQYNQFIKDRKYFAFDKRPFDPETYDYISEQRKLFVKYPTINRVTDIAEYPFPDGPVDNDFRYEILFFTDWGNKGLARQLAVDHGFSFEEP